MKLIAEEETGPRLIVTAFVSVIMFYVSYVTWQRTIQIKDLLAHAPADVQIPEGMGLSLMIAQGGAILAALSGCFVLALFVLRLRNLCSKKSETQAS